jgi:4'-phosphopantetheinyl transferase
VVLRQSQRSSTTLNQNTLHLWCAYPDDLQDEASALACANLLSEDERVRWQAFRHERRRREYLATHALVRTALSRHGQLAPTAWRFTKNAHGKPSIEPKCGLHFNLSNAPGLVVCLVAENAEVGVDVEPHVRAKSIAEVAQRMFSPQELAQLAALDEGEKLNRYLHLWTLKEAYVKARGMGLTLPTNKFSILFGGDDGTRMVMDAILGDDPDRWRFCLLNHADHCIALLVESRSALELKVWEARPPFAPPTPLAIASETWFPAR